MAKKNRNLLSSLIITGLLTACGQGDTLPTIKLSTNDSLSLIEKGGLAIIAVKANRAPKHNVVIDFNSSDASEGTVSPEQVIITAANWRQPQILTVSAVDDFQVDGEQSFLLQALPASSEDGDFDGLKIKNLSFTTIDDDNISLTLDRNQVTLSENGYAANTSNSVKITASLGSRPSGTVVFDLLSAHPDRYNVVPDQLILTPSNWQTQVTVTAVDDAHFNAELSSSIKLSLNRSLTSSNDGYARLEDSNLPTLSVILIDDTAAEGTFEEPSSLPDVPFFSTSIRRNNATAFYQLNGLTPGERYALSVVPENEGVWFVELYYHNASASAFCQEYMQQSEYNAGTGCHFDAQNDSVTIRVESFNAGKFDMFNAHIGSSTPIHSEQSIPLTANQFHAGTVSYSTPSTYTFNLQPAVNYAITIDNPSDDLTVSYKTSSMTKLLPCTRAIQAKRKNCQLIPTDKSSLITIQTSDVYRDTGATYDIGIFETNTSEQLDLALNNSFVEHNGQVDANYSIYSISNLQAGKSYYFFLDNLSDNVSLTVENLSKPQNCNETFTACKVEVPAGRNKLQTFVSGARSKAGATYRLVIKEAGTANDQGTINSPMDLTELSSQQNGSVINKSFYRLPASINETRWITLTGYSSDNLELSVTSATKELLCNLATPERGCLATGGDTVTVSNNGDTGDEFVLSYGVFTGTVHATIADNFSNIGQTLNDQSVSHLSSNHHSIPNLTAGDEYTITLASAGNASDLFNNNFLQILDQNGISVCHHSTSLQQSAYCLIQPQNGFQYSALVSSQESLAGYSYSISLTKNDVGAKILSYKSSSQKLEKTLRGFTADNFYSPVNFPNLTTAVGLRYWLVPELSTRHPIYWRVRGLDSNYVISRAVSLQVDPSPTPPTKEDLYEPDGLPSMGSSLLINNPIPANTFATGGATDNDWFSWE